MGAIDTKSFKSGNSVAVRFPRGTGLKPDVELTIRCEGDGFWVGPRVDPTEGKRRLLAMIAALDALGPVGEIEKRDPDIFPDRPGLYD